MLCFVRTEDCVLRSEKNDDSAPVPTHDFGHVIYRWQTMTCDV